MDINELVKAICDAAAVERSKYHLTLGGLIDSLEKIERAESTLCEFDVGGSPAYPHSYRGYYSDLAFERGDSIAVGQLLTVAKEQLGATHEGYKGGDFVMDEKTPLWCASYGCTGRAIVGIKMDETREGVLVLVTKDIDA